ncbi:hypothetical protein THAOC_35368 [Thalassiosira oceanica]|uniref:F-box domain-containing protein n=1 Tax=Thalassiosira oceanica TaxID=159749 RepID=K0RAC3_THAOC|nr:hypothetical protein THAOC_35368 [Thalassiosira oceanica]|eukprot:EJK45991.1 hypothetical protein THAOC_35368 [Thalassiosira oceanica]
MADDGGAKRLKKTSQDGVAIAEVTELRRRVEELRIRNAELESENERLRSDQRGRRREEGNHEVLPAVMTVTVTVDLSRVDTDLITHITSFLGTPRELLDLALTCKSFGWRQPATAFNWSLVEEVARQTVFSRATDAEMGCLPRYVRGVATWLSILHGHEHLLTFDVLLGSNIEHQNGDKTTIYGTGDNESSVAVSCGYVMTSGSHYAEFQISGSSPFIGIVRPMPGLDASAYKEEEFDFIGLFNFFPDFLAQRSDEWGDGNVHACEYNCGDGQKFWTDWEIGHAEWENWEGMEYCETGDTIGMLLNLVEGTLTVYKNNRRLGVMKDGLSGSYCWHAGVGQDGDTVTISKARIPTMAPSSPN